MNVCANVKEHLFTLSQGIGSRPTGTKKGLQAEDYAASVLQEAGFTVNKQPFACINWREGSAEISGEDLHLALRAAPYSLPCDAQGELLCVADEAALFAADQRGKLVLLHGALAKEELAPKNCAFWNPEEHQRLLAALENGGAKAILTQSLSPEGYLGMIEDGDFTVPCAMVRQSDLPALLAQQGHMLHLTIDAERREATAHNILATLGSADKKVCLSAHLDTKPTTPGALDDASGVAALLALAQALKGKQLPFAVEIALFSGEDYYADGGELLYMQTELSAPQHYHWAANVDGIGMQTCPSGISYYNCDGALLALLKAAAQQAGDIAEMEPWPQGDHTLFAMAGIPVISLTSMDIFTAFAGILHTARDIPEEISLPHLESAVRFLLDALDSFAATLHP